MKKIMIFPILAALVFLLCCPVYAADFSLDEKEIIYGMGGKSWYQGYEPVTRYNTMTICLPIRSDGTAGDLTASITLEDPDVFLLKSEPKVVTVSPADGIYPVKLTLSLEPNRQNGDYPALIRLTGQDESGTPLEQTIPYVIRIRDGKPNPETLRPAITQVSGQLNVGEEGALTLVVENPAATLAMTGAELTVTDGAGEVLMSGSNRLPLPEILPGQSVDVSVPMTVKGTAAVDPHTFEVKLSYQVLEQAQTWTESFTLPVTQEIRLEQGGIDLAPAATQGELTSLSLPLMNMGRAQILNAMVTLEMEGAVQRQSVLVGTLEPGETKQAKLTFTPGKDALGSYGGTITVTCEDAYGNTSSTVLPVELTVEEAKSTQDAASPEEAAREQPSWVLPALGVLCALLAATLILQGCLLRSKLHKLEEDRL